MAFIMPPGYPDFTSPTSTGGIGQFSGSPLGPGSMISGLYAKEAEIWGGDASGPVQRKGTAPYRTQGFQPRPSAPGTVQYPFSTTGVSPDDYPWIAQEAPVLETPEEVWFSGTFPEGGATSMKGTGQYARAQKRMFAAMRGYNKEAGMHADASDAQMERSMRQYFHGVGERRSYDDVISSYLKEEFLADSERQAAQAKYQNELRYQQLLSMSEAQTRNVMRSLENIGLQEREDLDAETQRALAHATQSAIGRGATSTGQLGAMSRQVLEARGSERRKVYNDLSRMKLGMEKSLTDQYMRIVEGRTDTYPDPSSIYQMVLQTSAGGVGQPAPQAQQASSGTGSAIAGAALGGLAALAFCCFIFLEVYGRELDEIVRRYRDEKMTSRNRRGYYRLADILVPLMRKSKLAKWLTRWIMCEPLIAYGRWYYRREVDTPSIWRVAGFVFKPVEMIWIGLFNGLGRTTEYIRANGEVV